MTAAPWQNRSGMKKNNGSGQPEAVRIKLHCRDKVIAMRGALPTPRA